MTQKNQIVIRADANARIGTGHLMRCLALAQAWQEAGGKATFLMETPSAVLENGLVSEGMAVKHIPTQPGSTNDAAHTAVIAREVNASWVVLDGYQFDEDYQLALKASGRKLLCVDDDGHANHYYADMVLNQNLYAHEGLYLDREPYTLTLLGAPYVLLRRQFEKWGQWQREIPVIARRILVTMGGGDRDNVTYKVIQALQQLDVSGLQIKIVVGAASPYFEMLKRTAQKSAIDMHILTAVSDMPVLMAWADVAITAGGSTCWEVAYMGLPNCIIVLADNQMPVAEVLQKLGVSVHMGWFDSLEPGKMVQVIGGLVQDRQRRKAMSDDGRSIIPGLGSRRVVQAMLARLN